MTAGAQGERHNKAVTVGGFGLTATDNIQKAIFFWAGLATAQASLCVAMCVQNPLIHTHILFLFG